VELFLAGLIPETFVHDVLDRTDLVQLIGASVKLHKAGSSYKGLCPFHQEKTPSFHVHPDRGFFYCFGCQKGGDSIRFLRQLHGYSFHEAIENLAERLGLQVPEGTGSGPARKVSGSDRKQLLDAHRYAQEFYVAQGAKDQAFARFLERRSLSTEVASRFGLGLALDAWDGLTSFLSRRSVEYLKIAVDAGLLVPRQSGSGHYDRFRNRVMFPIHDAAGAVVAYSGRTLERDADAAKYVNSPETRLYRKGKTLFGLFQARQALRKEDTAIIVEGNVDVVRLHDCGFESAVAPLGTAMTRDQASVIARFVSRVLLFYDGDSAGAQATLRAIPVLFGAGLDVLVVRPPEGRDPDDLLDDGAEAVQAVLRAATPAVHYLIQALRRQYGNSAAGTGRIVADALAVIASFPEEEASIAAAWKVYRLLGMERSVGDRSLRDRVGRERKRHRERGRTSQDGGSERSMDEEVVVKEVMSPIELQMGALLVRHAEFAGRFVDDGGLGLITHTELSRLIGQLAGMEDQERDESLQKLTADLLFGVPFPSDLVSFEELFQDLLVNLELANIERRSQRLQGEVDTAEQSGDSACLERLRNEKLSLVKRRIELQQGSIPSSTG